MSHASLGLRKPLLLSTSLLLGGQLSYIAVTQLHAGGHANNHHEIFQTYAHDVVWGGVHLGQFAAMALLVAGLVALGSSLTSREGISLWLSRFGVAFAVTALALYGVLQAVDGIALKQVVMAWDGAAEADKAARFASAETMRWLEWGMRSYHDFALGITLVLFAGAASTTRELPRGLGPVMGLSGLAYLAQGWIAGAEGFSSAQSLAIVLGWVLCLSWMSWLATWAWLDGSRIDQVAGSR